MTQAKQKVSYTPGPWQHGENQYTGITNQPPQLPLSFQRIYMPGNAMAFVTGESREANARAIAAVPDLIEALEAIQARISGTWDNAALVAFGPLSTDTLQDIRFMAEKALAKASIL